MARKKKTWFTILGLLSWKPMSGYDIKKYIEIGLSHFWSESYGQLFPALNSLVEQGLATRQQATSAGKRKKNIYTISPQGRQQFLVWLGEPVEQMTVRNEALLKFFLSSKVSTTQSIHLIEQYLDQQQSLYRLYQQSEVIYRQAIANDELPEELLSLLDWHRDRSSKAAVADRQQLEIFYLTLRHGVLHVKARLAWCEEALARLHYLET